MQLRQHLTQLLHRAQPAGHPAITDEPHRPRFPGCRHLVDELFERRRIAVVVLRGDDQKGIGAQQLLQRLMALRGELLRLAGLAKHHGRVD